MFQVFAKFGRALRVFHLRAQGAKIGHGLQSFDSFFGGIASGFECDEAVYLSSGCKILVAQHGGISGRLRIGRNVFINHYSIIDCHHSITIGNSVLIGPYCYIADYDHGTSPTMAVGAQPEGPAAPVCIFDGAWLGAGVIVLKGVTIGEGAVVGAGSVVTNDVPANSIWAGNPARLLRPR
jgi:acetyltransferase-like isoleucine patch superfamily enzyme